MLHAEGERPAGALNIHSAAQFPCGFGVPFSSLQPRPDKLIDTVSGGHIEFIRECREPLSKLLIFHHIALGILIRMTESAICCTNIYHLRAYTYTRRKNISTREGAAAMVFPQKCR